MKNFWRSRVFLSSLLLFGGMLAGAFATGSRANEMSADLTSAFKNIFSAPAEKTLEIPLTAPRVLPEKSAPEAKSAPAKAVVKKPAVSKPAPKKTETTGAAKKISASSTVPGAEKNTPAVPKTCPWKTFGVPEGRVVINEVAWGGTEESADEEWIELRNIGGWSVNLSGYLLVSKSGHVKTELPDVDLEPGGFLVAARKGSALAHAAEFSGALSNGGEWLKLFGKDCRLVDELRADKGWPAGNSSDYLTLERKPSGSGWQSGEPDGSPGLANHTAFTASVLEAVVPEASAPEENAPPANAHILIYSVRTAGEGSDDDRITLYNSGADSADISGWKLRKRTKSGTESSVKTLAGEIPGSGYYVWANSKHPAGADEVSTQTISADNSVALLNSEDALQDALAWGAGTNQFKEGNPFPENPASGAVLTRKGTGGTVQDTNDNSADFEIK